MFTPGLVLNYSTGAQTAFTAQANIVSANDTGSLVSLNTIGAGTTVSSAGLVLPIVGVTNIEFESLAAKIQTRITTNTITVTPRWEVSDDNTNWRPLFAMNSAAYVTTPAAGTGSLVNTCYELSLAGVNPAARYLRIAFTVGVTTGGAGDSVVANYRWRKRFVAPMG